MTFGRGLEMSIVSQLKLYEEFIGKISNGSFPLYINLEVKF